MFFFLPFIFIRTHYITNTACTCTGFEESSDCVNCQFMTECVSAADSQKCGFHFLFHLLQRLVPCVTNFILFFFVVIYCYLFHSSDLTVFLHMFSELPNSFTEINWGCVQMYPAVSPVSAAERSQLHSRPDRDGTNTSTCLFRVTSICHLWL